MGRGWTLRAAALAVLLPGSLGAQAGERLVCRGGVDPVGSLGITGISCDRCQFFTNGKMHRAVFWTEPTILELDQEHPAAAVLREGDVLIAVDGELITTREGSARFSALPVGEATRLRIRREGRATELSVPVVATCPDEKSGTPSVAGRPVPVRPPRPPVEAAVTPRVPAKPVPSASAPRRPVAPVPPPPPRDLAPHVSLGFGFSCTDCGWSTTGEGETGRWRFSEAPELVGVDETSRAAGLRPGDRLLALDGVSLTTEEGGRRFAAIRPRDTLRWTVERSGRTLEVRTVAAAPEPSVVPAGAPVAALPLPDASKAPIRFTGMIGDVAVELRGAGRVYVTEEEDGRLVIIRTGDAEIRLRAPGGRR